ncbi:MAG: thiamine phosphate synthase [Desulfuromusa sp.]
MAESLPNLYLITDRHQLPKGHHLLDVIEALLQAGLRMIQLREKDLTVAELYPLAKKLRSLTQQYKSLLLINDRLDLAQAIGADGVHLGNHSLPIKVARRILGSKFLIGASTHSATEIEAASQQGADFVTYGPIFFTPSKAAYGEPVGISSLQAICTTRTIPIYALGGIQANNVKETMLAGAHGVAMISALLSDLAPKHAFQKLSYSLSLV